MISYFMVIHIGSPEGVTLLEFEEEAEENQETPQPAAPKGEEPATEELPECPDHRPTSFMKGEPPKHFKSLLSDLLVLWTDLNCLT